MLILYWLQWTFCWLQWMFAAVYLKASCILLITVNVKVNLLTALLMYTIRGWCMTGWRATEEAVARKVWSLHDSEQRRHTLMQNRIASVYLLLTTDSYYDPVGTPWCRMESPLSTYCWLLTTDYSECLRGCSSSHPSSTSSVTDYSECLLLSGFTDYSERLWALRFCTAHQTLLWHCRCIFPLQIPMLLSSAEDFSTHPYWLQWTFTLPCSLFWLLIGKFTDYSERCSSQSWTRKTLLTIVNVEVMQWQRSAQQPAVTAWNPFINVSIALSPAP